MSTEIAKDNTTIKPKAILGLRHAQTLLLFLAMVLAFGMRVNMSMAIVEMTDLKNENSFDWNSQRQSVILSSYFWGYVVLQIPGGELAAKFRGKLLVLWCIGINSVISLLIPFAAYYGGWQLVCACRVIQGLSQGTLFPTIHSLIGQWIPLEEKGRLGTIIYSGGQLGTAIQFVASGFIAHAWGWPAIFYINGTIGAIWTVVYVYVEATSPKTCRLIGAEEKLYIESSLGHIEEKKKLRTPWKDILTSLPFFGLIVANCGQNWGMWTLLTETPSYVKQVLGVDISANGVMSALPYLTMYLLSFPMGFLTDYTLKKKWLSVTASRKICNTIGQWGPALGLIWLSYTPADITIAITVLCIVVGLNAGSFTGYLIVHIDMAPNFAGTLIGITNCIANFIALFGPLSAGYILTDQTNADQWSIVFYLAAGVYFFCNLGYLIFGTSERQAWNEPKTDSSDDVTDATAEKNSERVV